MTTNQSLIFAMMGIGALVGPSFAEDTDARVEALIAGALSPAPPEHQDSATVMGFTEDGSLETLREGTGTFVCLADDPRDERFHVACYHRDLEAFMARGRALRAQEVTRDEVQRIRQEEIDAGKLAMPKRPTALYSFTGPAGSLDPSTGEVTGATRVYVVYIPYATEESTGLSPTPLTPGAPWIMSPGTAWSHIMVVQADEEKDSDEN